MPSLKPGTKRLETVTSANFLYLSQSVFGIILIATRPKPLPESLTIARWTYVESITEPEAEELMKPYAKPTALPAFPCAIVLFSDL